MLEIEVVDVNDEPPVFQTPENFIFAVNEKASGIIGRIEAYDLDSAFVFQIPENSLISVDESTGILALKKKANRAGLFGFKCYLNDGVKKTDRIFFIKFIQTAPASDEFTVMTELPVDPAVIALHYIQGRRHFIKTSSPPRLSSLLKYSSRFGILYWKDKSTRIAGNLTVAALEERTQLLTEKVIFIEGSPFKGLAPAIIPPPPPLIATKIQDQKPRTIYLELNVSESENIGNIVGKLNFTKGSHFDGSRENALIVNSIGEIIVSKLIDFEMVEKFQIIFCERDLRRPSWFSKVEVSFNVIDGTIYFWNAGAARN